MRIHSAIARQARRCAWEQGWAPRRAAPCAGGAPAASAAAELPKLSVALMATPRSFMPTCSSARTAQHLHSNSASSRRLVQARAAGDALRQAAGGLHEWPADSARWGTHRPLWSHPPIHWRCCAPRRGLPASAAPTRRPGPGPAAPPARQAEGQQRRVGTAAALGSAAAEPRLAPACRPAPCQQLATSWQRPPAAGSCWSARRRGGCAPGAAPASTRGGVGRRFTRLP